MLLCNQYFFTIYEYATNKLIAYAPKTNELHLIDNWADSRVIEDTNPGNDSKFWIQQMPHFNIEKFPFLIVAGYENYELVNVKTEKMYPFICGSAYPVRA